MRPWSSRLREAIGALPAGLARSITCDQGKAMAYHADFAIATGIPVHFCDSRSPWQQPVGALGPETSHTSPAASMAGLDGEHVSV
jgi:IS30 family transposase